MKILIVMSLVITCSHCFGQKTDTFFIKEIIDSTQVSTFRKNNVRTQSDQLYEDSTYIVSKSCSGEFGGSVKFKNKKTGITYAAAATCPVSVNKLTGKYYVTSSLAHLNGASQILEIHNPDLMSRFQLAKPRRMKGKLVKYVGDDESKSTLGTTTILAMNGILIIASFSFNDQLYHITSDFERTYVATVENKRFVTQATIAETRIAPYESVVYKSDDGYLIVMFKNPAVEGYVSIYENEITLVRNR